MQKLLVICGPTATGKTLLGIRLAKKFKGEIISADSRQVYKRMDIGTGKDVPSNSKLHITDKGLVYYEVDGVKVWGYDLVGPKEEFSVSQYTEYTKNILFDINKRNKLPIIVGGTGFYIKAIIDGIPTVDVPRNNELREQLSGKTKEELFETLSQVDSIKAASMNLSDRKNPRRLARAIEVAQFLIDHQLPIDRSIGSDNFDILFIGLTAPESFVEEKINIRVDSRVNNGFEDEVKNLLELGVDWSDQSMMSFGYRQWRDFIEGAVDKETATSEWKKEERKYAKRQMVWFKRDSRINWFDISKPNYSKKVENMIEKWHNK